MATKKTLEHLKDREGVKYESYLDSLKKPTAGVGHLLNAEEQKLYPIGTEIPEAQVNKWLKEDLAKAEAAAKTQADQMRAKGLAVDPNFEESLISVNFQLGTGWTKKFPSAWNNLQSGDYKGAISEIQFADPNKKPGVKSNWAKQTPVRVDDFTQAIRNQADYETETVTEEGPGFYDRFTSGIKELLPFNKGGTVEEITLDTIDITPSNSYRNYMMQEAARRSMMQGNEEERMADYDYARDYAEDYPYLYPRRARSVTRPPMQAAQRMMGGFAQGGVVDQAQGLASLGRGGDSTLVHMQPREVAGLQQLAQANGTSLTRNPMTGMPEAFSLGGMFKAALPIAAGYFAGPGAAFGLEAGGTAALAAGAATGAGVAAATGDDPIMGAVTGGLGGMSGGGLNTAMMGPSTATGMAGTSSIANPLAGATPLPKVVGSSGLATGGGYSMPGEDVAITATRPATQRPIDFSGSFSQGLDQARTNLGTVLPDGTIEKAGNLKLAKTFGAPIASMGLGGLEESDFMVKPDFNDPRDKYDPRSRLDLNRDTGINEALSRDTGLRLLAKGGYLKGPGDGMSDDIPATINGEQPAALADGEFVVPADVVSHLGNGSSEAGSKQLYAMMDRIRKARTGKKSQGKEIKPGKYMPR